MEIGTDGKSGRMRTLGDEVKGAHRRTNSQSLSLRSKSSEGKEAVSRGLPLLGNVRRRKGSKPTFLFIVANERDDVRGVDLRPCELAETKVKSPSLIVVGVPPLEDWFVHLGVPNNDSAIP